MNILDYEEKYSKKFVVFANDLKKLSDEIVKHGEIDFNNKEVTKAILIRLKYYYEYQENIKKILNKRYASPAADFFVETIAFYLATAFKIYKLPLEVHSERNIRDKRGSIRPDISIWLDHKVIAMIECKTQLGWNRDNWKKDFIERENILKNNFPEAHAYLFVTTSLNWGGFGEEKDVGRKYFCLSKEWPYRINLDSIDDCILNPIEPNIAFFIQNYKR